MESWLHLRKAQTNREGSLLFSFLKEKNYYSIEEENTHWCVNSTLPCGSVHSGLNTIACDGHPRQLLTSETT